MSVLFDLFVNRCDTYALGYLAPGGKRMGYKKVLGPVTEDLIQQHLEGSIVLGVYQLKGDAVKWGCLDFDADTPEDFEGAKKLYSYLKSQGCHPLFEMSGGGEYKCHVWIFAEINAYSMKVFLEDACKACKVQPHEIFPKQTKVLSGEYGNLLKLPLALHKVTGKRSHFLDDNFEIVEDYDAILKFHLENKESVE